MLNFHLISLFPETVEAYLQHSILKRAQEKGKIKLKTYNPRDFTKDKLKRVDNKPYGGGPGMVLEAEPLLKAAQKALGKKARKDLAIIFFTPSGKKWNNEEAKKLSKKKHIIMIAGHYEGIDARVQKILRAKEYSVGDFVTTGGELPAMIVIDTVTRQIPGVLGNEESLEENRTASPEVYTRPESFKWKGKNYKVPKVLLSGHHKKIKEWKEEIINKYKKKYS